MIISPLFRVSVGLNYSLKVKTAQLRLVTRQNENVYFHSSGILRLNLLLCGRVLNNGKGRRYKL